MIKKSKNHIRAASHADIEALFVIHMDPTVNPYMDFEPMIRDDYDRMMRQKMIESEVFVSEQEGQVVGTFAISQRSNRRSHVLYIGAVGVLEQYQGQGLGNEMMQFILETARSRGIKRLELGIEEDNLRALKFYQRYGFSVEGN